MQLFKQQLLNYLGPEQVIDNPMLCYSYSTDASLYRLVPKIVVFVNNGNEVRYVLQLANLHKQPITFRAAGTSLSGQAVTDQVLIVLSPGYWQDYEIINNGAQIRLSSGIIGAIANSYLKPYNKKIGPDPASIDSCKIGGIVANNSSGMCCGTTQNTYQTMHQLKITLANGTTLDTSDSKSRTEFIKNNSILYNGIKNLHRQVNQNQQLVELIKHKYKIKNTTAYSLNSFIDYHDPIDIIAHLIVGSEGTLGFINEITYNTVPNNPFKAVSLVCLNSLQEILDLTTKLKQYKIDAIELFDITSLNAIKEIPIANKYLPHEINHDVSAILIEISGENTDELDHNKAQIESILDNQQLLSQVRFTQDEVIYNELWKLRKSIITAVGANRPDKSTMVIEDIAVEIDKLADLAHDLRALFIKYNYTNAAIFGHVLAGNIHFIFTPQFDNPTVINTYKSFMDEMCTIVTQRYNGSLKAEHGVGRNIAPYVELEWGNVAYQLMWQIKKLFDPNNILNPDVKLSLNPNIHMTNLKQMPSIPEPYNKCIECGFCESVCPSLKLNLSPRQRIASYRYLMSDENIKKAYAKDYERYAINSCATTGLCQTKCPVGINTGNLILELKSAQYGKPRYIRSLALYLRLQKFGLRIINIVQKLIGKQISYKVSKRINKVIPIVPVVLPTTPKVQNIQYNNVNLISQQKIIYIPSCNNRIMGDESNNILELLNKLNIQVIYPDGLNNLCCGQLDLSRGDREKAQFYKNYLSQLIQTSKFPVLIDNSSCFNQLAGSSNIIDVIDLVYDNLVKINPKKLYSSIVLHIDCSTRLINKQQKIITILDKLTSKIIIPNDIYCCGFAGNKGFFHPELNQSALSTLEQQIKEAQIGVTFNRNCQIGLSLHGKKNYVGLAELILNII